MVITSISCGVIVESGVVAISFGISAMIAILSKTSGLTAMPSGISGENVISLAVAEEAELVESENNKKNQMIIFFTH